MLRLIFKIRVPVKIQSYSALMNLFTENPQAYQYPQRIRQLALRLQSKRVNFQQINQDRLRKFLIAQIQQDKILVNKQKQVLFVGRSNVGKSSLINALLDSKVCRVSKHPGTTKQLHFHGLAPGKGVIVDVPGYGFANMNQRRRKYWLGTVYDYAKISSRISKIFILLDFEHGCMAHDLSMMRRLDPLNVEYQIVFTKADKVEESSTAMRILSIGRQLQKFQLKNLSPIAVLTSTRQGFGIKQMKQCLTFALQYSKQRQIDGFQDQLIQYLRNSRVHPQDIQSRQSKKLTRHYQLSRLFYASKYSRYLKS